MVIVTQNSFIQRLKETDGKITFMEWRSRVCGSQNRNLLERLVEHFHNRFKGIDTPLCFKLDGLSISKISHHFAGELEFEFLEQEIKEALLSINPGKSPGPDGFNGFYIRNLWDTLKDDIIDFHKVFHENSSLPKGINSSFLALIPKLSNPRTVQDFLPISLINCTLKILLKLLATRLKPMLNILVSEVQFAFVQGRHITDCIFIVNEMTHSMQQNLTQGAIFKVDFEKAFDSIRWDFLTQILELQGFGSKWIGWIMSILSTTRLSILINGSPTREFTMSKGLRQGDPLSPLLYILVSEVLHLLIQRAEEVNIITGCKLDKYVSLKHLQFADDTIVFLDNKASSFRGIKSVLIIFQMLTGLKVNFHKGSRDAAAIANAEVLGCKHGTFPFQYLRATMGGKPQRKSFWNPMIKKIKTKLAAWRCTSLLKASRLLFIKAVIDSIPMYWLSLNKLPAGVLKEIEKIKRRFLWGEFKGNNSWTTRKLHTIRWEIICKPKTKGGLGVQVLAWKNVALLAKWWWKARIDRSKLWHRVLTCKYGDKFFSDPKGGGKFISPMVRHISACKEFDKIKVFDSKDLYWTLGQRQQNKILGGQLTESHHFGGEI